MIFLIILCSLLTVESANNHCLKQITDTCMEKHIAVTECGAKYGEVYNFHKELQDYVNLHISSSFNYLVMATRFGGYIYNREGLEKILRHLSDSTWKDAIELIKYMNKRGMQVKLGEWDENKGPGIHILSEVTTLAHVLDSQKEIATKALHIHGKATKHSGTYDPEVASFLENRFLHRHADIIRNLAGLTKDLRELISKDEIHTLSYFLFDEYLKEME